MNLNEKIRLRREELGLTLEDVGVHIGVSKSTVLKYENGEIKNLKLETIEKLAEILRLSPCYLMGWQEQPSSLEKLITELTDEEKIEVKNYVKYIISKRG